MNIDERLEALAHNIEILNGMQMANERRFEANERRFEEIERVFTQVRQNFEIVLDSIKGLENIAAAHEHRIEDLEDRPQS